MNPTHVHTHDVVGQLIGTGNAPLGATTGRVDVHAHYIPTSYRQALTEAGIGMAGGVPIPLWTPELALDFMDLHGIAAQVVSIADPGLGFLSGTEARTLARQINEYGAELIRRWPHRFGALAVLPLPDVEGATAEAGYALDSLGLDGVCLLSSYAGSYLGDARFDPLLAALDARGAYVMVHPATPPDDDIPHMAGIPHAIIEYPFDTTRAATNLIWKSALTRFPRLRWALSHAGGSVPFLAHRITGWVGGQLGDQIECLSQLYYDTALSPVRPAMQSLLEVAPLSHILFGSDWPFAGFLYPATGDPQPQLGDTFDEAQLRAIGRDNALHQFPRLAVAMRRA